jgi:lycopene cyclase domain-containing protein
MSYLAFLLLFLGVPLVALLLLLRTRLRRQLWRPLALTAAAALLYTAPWDNAIIRNGVWSYAPSRVLGLVIGAVPIEEYAFYLLQVLFVGLLTVWVVQRRPHWG